MCQITIKFNLAISTVGVIKKYYRNTESIEFAGGSRTCARMVSDRSQTKMLRIRVALPFKASYCAVESIN